MGGTLTCLEGVAAGSLLMLHRRATHPYYYGENLLNLGVSITIKRTTRSSGGQAEWAVGGLDRSSGGWYDPYIL